MFGALSAAEGSAPETLIDVAREFSPRIEIHGPRAFDTAQARAFDAAQARAVVLDLSGLTRLFGDARAMGHELLRTAAERGLRVRVAIAGTRTAARLLACAAGGPLTVIDPGTEATALAPLPLTVLAYVAKDSNGNGPKNGNGPNVPNDPSDSILITFRRWGLRTCGDVAALPSDAVAARLGQEGVRWQRLARGEDPRPLLPAIPEERFEQALDLEWPIEGLEPLSFVLGRLMDPLSAHLERRGRGAAVLHVRLHLVTRAVHERSLQLPASMRDARTLRTLALLDLESHPPAAAIDRVVVAVDPTPARVLQFSLLTRPLPSPEQISTLMARLTALMGEGRCGSPALVDSWQPGAFAMKAFAPRDSSVIHRDRPQRHGDTEPNLLHTGHGAEPRSKGLDGLCASVPLWPVGVNAAPNHPAVALRRFRFPVPARVRVEQGRPWRVVTDRRGPSGVPAARSLRGGVPSGGGVTQCAGPWRTAGNWWTERAWDRDEWDVTLSDGATCRVFRDRSTGAWFLEGVVD